MNVMLKPSGMTDDLRAAIAAIGPNFDLKINETTRAMYAKVPHTPPGKDVTVTLDIAYGSDPRQQLDLYATSTGNPVVIFIPGGGYVGGDKRGDDVFYGNLGAYFANHGYPTILANYRLAPAHPYPAGAQDVGNAVKWAMDNAARHGGDPGRIFIIGQSAGASHVSAYLFDPEQFKVPANVRAGVLLSGGYKAVSANPSPGVKAYFGNDTSLYEARQAAGHAKRSKVPLAISIAEFDPIHLAGPGIDLAREVLERDGKSAPFAVFRHHNHVSTVFSFGTADDEIGSWIRSFFAEHA